MAVYKISVKDPNSDGERNINGSIVFKTLGDKYTAIANVKGLPKPFTTTSTYIVNGKTANDITNDGEFTVEGDEGLAEHIDTLVEEIIDDIVDVINNIYDVNLSSRIIAENDTPDPIEPTTTEPTSATQSDTQPIGATTSSTSNNVFTFNVERDGVFIPISNNNSTIPSSIGELFLIDESDGSFVFNDDFEDLSELDPEFSETDFDGLDEQEYQLQDEISNNINDQEQSENLQNTDTGVVVDIKPVNSFDELLRLAGKLARALGKNERVNYENLNKGYVKGVHGLCPQGTQAVLYALTGIKELGKITGNADWFSFKTPGTGGGNSSFSTSGYYNNKVKITQLNGSWKGTYIQEPSQWQIGDIIAMGYIDGKKYGHIQIWTGVKWMSDFKQNAIQQNKVDVNTVALWRLNERGISAVRAQSSNIGGKIS